MRTATATVLGVLAVLLITLSSVSVWARGTVVDSERFSAIVVASLDEEAVADGLATTITEQLVAAIDLESELADLLPGDDTRLAGILAGAAADQVERRLTDLLEDPRTQDVVERLVEIAHDRVLDLLRGGSLVDGFTVEDGTVTLNLLPLIGRGLEQLQTYGLLDDVDVPEMTAAGDPEEQAAALSEALGRDLPDDFGQVVVYRSDRLAKAEASVREAQRIVAVAADLFVALLVGAVVTTVGAVVAARDRWLAALRLALGLVGALGLLRAGILLLIEQAPSLASRPGGRAAIDAVLTEGTAGLLRLGAAAQLVAALVVVVALWRRGWRRGDLVSVAVVLAVVLCVLLVGLGAGGLVTALLVGGGLVVADRVLLRDPPTAPV